MSSDEEFWNIVEAPLYLKEPKLYKCTDFFEIKAYCNISIRPGGKLEKLVNNVRLAKEEELKMQKILVRQRTIKEVNVNADEIRKRYADEVVEIIAESNKMKDDLIEMKKDLNKAHEDLIVQEQIIGLYRVGRSFKYFEKKDPQVVEDQSFSLKSQLRLMKEVCKVYLDKMENMNGKICKLTEEIDQTKSTYEQDIQKILKEKDDLEKDLNTKLNILSQEFSKYQNDVKLEMSVQEAIHKKQAHTILLLKEDIKKAQIVLQTPRLRQRTYERYSNLNPHQENLSLPRSTKNKSIILLPQVNEERDTSLPPTVKNNKSEKNVFTNTLVPLSNNSSKFLDKSLTRKQGKVFE
ncbi:hypothetical protein SteCoe_9822 [Stentor coeruleus]|uniref:Uncharacterized protein n=1 Tax=Stentor coeruleus TaxID=5963 RepID=A0A1R2CGZ8_9CILI|nr:hypothetical protein SteCoe_9822 [Stentor coeruleus]